MNGYLATRMWKFVTCITEHSAFRECWYIWMNELISSLDRKIRQSVKQEHRGTITACAYRCPESTIIQLRGTIVYVVKTQHYESKSCLVIKRTKTHTLNVTQRRKNAEQYTHDQLVTTELLQNFARSVECTARLKAASDEKSVLAGSKFNTVKILRDENFIRTLQEYCGSRPPIICKRVLTPLVFVLLPNWK